MNKKIKLLSLISTPILLGGGFATLTLVNQCGSETIHYNFDGTNWEGRTGGSLEVIINPNNDTAFIYTTSNYEANNLVIPDEVWDGNKSYPLTYIEDYAFQSSTTLRGTLTLGKNIDAIGFASFRSCNGLTGELKLPDNLLRIYDYAFYQCGHIESLNFPKNLQNIGMYAFSYCMNLTSPLNIPSTVVSIGNNAFEQDVKVSSITIPSSVRTISSSAFSNVGQASINGVTLELVGFDPDNNPITNYSQQSSFHWASPRTFSALIGCFANLGYLHGEGINKLILSPIPWTTPAELGEGIFDLPASYWTLIN